MILGSLYESLGLAIETLKNIKPKDNLLLARPYWLLKIWLNSMFKISLNVNKPDDACEDIKNRCIKGIRLARMAPVDANQTYQESFRKYFMMLAKRHNFTHTMTSFVNISHKH